MGKATKETKHAEMLKTIGKALTSTLHRDGILEQIMEFTGRIFNPDNWSLLMTDEQKGDLYFAIVVGEASSTLEDARVSLHDSIAGWSVKNKKAVVLPSVKEDERFSKMFDNITGFKTRSVICVPLVSKNRAVGVIELINAEKDCFDQDSLEILNSLADFAAIAIENARYVKQIENMAIKDDCTELYNARHMITLLDAEINRAERTEESFCIVFLDLDHFKEVNDNYGHLVGSSLLRKIAKLIISNIRPTDWAARYGGDEFLYILPSINKKTAMKITERIRNKLKNSCFFSKKGYNIKVTGSFGIASFPSDGISRDELINRADKAMYISKETGRDKTTFYTSNLNRSILS